MSEFRERLAEAVKRAETWGKRTVVTAEIAAHVASPLAGTVAQQADLVSAKPPVQMSQDLAQERLKELAENDLRQKEQQASRIDVTRQQAAPQMVRGSRDQSPDKSKERSRDR